MTDNKILVRMPTRGRHEQALAVVKLYRDMAGMPISIEIILDEDEALHATRYMELGCSVTVGKHGSKIEACNDGKCDDWDILVLASDDMWPVKENYAVRILEEMNKHWPHRDGAVYFNDGVQGSNLSTLPILGRRLYEQFNSKVYAPEYTSLFCDTEQTMLLTMTGRLIYHDEHLIEHRHHQFRKSQNDALYQRNDAFWAKDEAVFNARRATKRANAQWPFDSPPLWLSILIASLPLRRDSLDRLLAELFKQMREFPREVEIIVDSAPPPMTVGGKRQGLLHRARGHFVCFVDDDDAVSSDYVKKIVTALREQPDVDCTSLTGVMTTGGMYPERFEHSIKHQAWQTVGNVHLRSPHHLNAVRRDHALKAGFENLRHGEDHGYSMRLLPLLKKEAWLGEEIMYRYNFRPSKLPGS